MDKGKIAEELMSLVMERPQAAAVVGDLLESGASRGTGWFWSNVFRTWSASVWRDGQSQPRFVLGMAVLGTVVHAAACFVVSLGFFIVTSILVWALSFPPSIQEAPALWFVEKMVVLFMVPLYVGGWIARYSLGRDVAVCIAMVVIGPMVMNLFRAMFWLAELSRNPVPEFTFIWWNGWVVFSFIPYLLGAAWVCRRQQKLAAIQVRSLH